MDTAHGVTHVKRKAKILVYTVSIVVLAQIAIFLVIASMALNKVHIIRQDEMRKAFDNYLNMEYLKLEASVTGYAYWTEVCDEINRLGRLSPILAESWLKGNADQNDYVAIMHKGEVILEGGRAIMRNGELIVSGDDEGEEGEEEAASSLADEAGTLALASFVRESFFKELYDAASMVEDAHEEHYLVHYNSMTVLFVLAPNADNDWTPQAEGVQIFAKILDKTLDTAGTFLAAQVSFEAIEVAAESFEIPLTDVLDENAVRMLHVAPLISLGPLVYLPMFGSLGAQLIITIGIIIVFFILLGTITKLFNQISELYGEVKKNNDRMEAEMRLAGFVQKGILPEEGTYRGRLPIGKLAVKFAPSKQVSGDVYDVVVTDTDEWVIIMDLTGHGLPAALLTSFATMAFREEVRHCSGPAELFKKMSSRLERYLPEGTFVVALCAKISGDTIEFSNAGGEDCLLYKKNQNKLYLLKSSGTMLGISGAETWTDCRFELETGDRLLIFTDGILDMPIIGGDKLGNEAFVAIAKKYIPLHPQLVVDKMFSDIEGMSRAGVERDDISMLCIGKE
jgi:serine phosphatase RsbU (regulator of sigma subunit)